MTLTFHVVSGAALGTVIGNPVAGFLLGIASHLLLDIIPHGDTGMANKYENKTNKTAQSVAKAYVSIDAAIGIMVLAILSAILPPALTDLAYSLTIMGAILPDLLVGLAELFKRSVVLRKIKTGHFVFHNLISKRFGDIPLSLGLSLQLVAMIIIFDRILF